jgi:DNA (cytosine-5)-methyltransferase 1
MTLTVGSLFSGIGGLELGLERAGMKTVWQVECDPYAQKVLAKHWPVVERFGDVRDVGAHNLSPVDLVCGGFPCQDISSAGLRAGIAGERSGLWSQFRRLICELRPGLVIVENVSALLVRGIERVLGDMAELGLDAEWSVLPACAVGAPHERERVFIVAYPNGVYGEEGLGLWSKPHEWREVLPCGDRPSRALWMASEPVDGGVVDGFFAAVDRTRALGNAVVPQVAEFIGRRILAREAAR